MKYIKGIDRGYFIFSASAKTNCWILELCIWLVRKLIGLPLLKRTPHQSKAEACYRQITCFYKKKFVSDFAKTNDAVRSTTVYVTDETYKKILSRRFWVVGVRCLLIAPFVINPAKMPFFQISLLYFNFELLLLKKRCAELFLLTWAKSTENFGSIRCIVFAQLHSKIRKYSNYN